MLPPSNFSYLTSNLNGLLELPGTPNSELTSHSTLWNGALIQRSRTWFTAVVMTHYTDASSSLQIQHLLTLSTYSYTSPTSLSTIGSLLLWSISSDDPLD